MKRFNPFSIAETIEKYDVTLDIAIEIVKKVKLQRSTNIDGFIFRYGEDEGTKRYNEYCNKSKHSKETFKAKYGKNWEENWNKYILSKTSRSLESMIVRHGIIDGTAKFNEITKNYKYSMSLESYIDKYGEELGVLNYNKLINSMDSSTLEFHIKKYGLENGKNMYIKRSLKKDSSSKEFFIKKYGTDDGIIRFNKKKMECSPIFNQLLKIYDAEDAIIKYNNYLSTKIESSEIVCIKKEINEKFKLRNNTKRSCSTQANTLFALLSEQLNYTLHYGSRKNEISVFDDETCKTYYYDCFDENTNTIIEFNGSLFHANPLLADTLKSTWTTAYGLSYNDSLSYDAKKINIALAKNYKVIIVWDYEISNKNKLYNKVNELKRIINNESN